MDMVKCLYCRLGLISSLLVKEGDVVYLMGTAAGMTVNMLAR